LPPALPFTYQIADVVGAGKLKLILPLRKGNALDLEENEFISLQETGQCFDRLTEARAVHDWRPALRMTCWTPETEGHMILVEVTGQASAWPVYDRPDLLEPLGNLLHEPVSQIWSRYRFKHNHFAKYLGASIRTRPTRARRPVRGAASGSTRWHRASSVRRCTRPKPTKLSPACTRSAGWARSATRSPT
jgi:hypothetical protein